MTVYHSSVPTLHITNGSCAGDTLKMFVDGPVLLAHDVLHEGPAPHVDDDAWHDVRGGFLAGAYGLHASEIAAELAATDRRIRDGLSRGDHVVLWFEHDLFDQLELIRTLDLIGRTSATLDRVSLICIDRFPGVERFIGLGQLDPAQLASLVPSRQPVTREQIALAAAAWEAFRSPDPTGLVDLARRSQTDPALPFLGDALLRFLAEYPSVENGLTRTETLALDTLTTGPLDGATLFTRSQAREPRPFIGDSCFFDALRALANVRVPLVAISDASPDEDLRRHTIELLDAGRDVLSGRLDRVVLNGIDLWRGGVHLNGAAPVWRWDAGRKTLVK
jgi:hypothetical protein